MKPILYAQKSSAGSRLAFDFCYSAMLGADEMQHKVKTFANYKDIPNKPNHVVVGSVEQCQGWLELNDYKVPDPINILEFSDFLKRTVTVHMMSNVSEFIKSGPIFIKPTKLKAFTGFQTNSMLMTELFSEGYRGEILIQEVIDIVSEYRVYVTDGKIIGCKHYSGDPLRFPDGDFIKQVFERSKEILNLHSYTIDVAVLYDGTTALIELNDGWSCGNYGLEPQDYYLFCRNRWLQITGLRK
jgi:hypothetical protein